MEKSKNEIQNYADTSRELIPGYIDEHNWRQFNGKKTLVAFDNILDQISEYYIVNA